MIIEKLFFMDFRSIHDLEVDLAGKSTILYGINGVGKSSILAGINLLYASIINRLVKQKFKQSIKFEDSDIKYKKASAMIAAEFGLKICKILIMYTDRLTARIKSILIQGKISMIH